MHYRGETMGLRHLSMTDRICLEVDQIIRTVCHNPKTTGRLYPGLDIPDPSHKENERRSIAALMRINHAGEVSAQALYHGQSLASSSEHIKNKMQQAAIEEGDHLAWCYLRLMELHSHTSYLNLFWYLGSFSIGLCAGLLGDQWSLGFLAETENQVVDHLESHLKDIAKKDQRSYKILQQMQDDEARHRDDAIAVGAKPLPQPIKKAMRFLSKVMVKTAYWI